MELAVGDSTEIELIFNSGRYKGNVFQSAAIFTNDTTAERLFISLTAKVTENPDSTFPLVISPPHLDFSPVKDKKVVTGKVKIKNVSQEKIKFKLVDSPVGFFRIRFSSKEIKPSELIKLEARLNRKMKDDSFKRSITVELDDKAKSRFTIPAKREVEKQKENK